MRLLLQVGGWSLLFSPVGYWCPWHDERIGPGLRFGTPKRGKLFQVGLKPR